MLMSSQAIARLIEPTLLAITRPDADGVGDLQNDARAFTHSVQAEMKARGEVLHQPSFELGAGTAFVEILATVQQRSGFANALRIANEVPRGLDVLHLIALQINAGSSGNQGELADQLNINRGNFSRHIRRLEEAGLVHSQRANRNVTYSLSMLGMDVLDHLRAGWSIHDPRTNPGTEVTSQARMASVSALAVSQGASLIQLFKAADFVEKTPKEPMARRSDRLQWGARPRERRHRETMSAIETEAV